MGPLSYRSLEVNYKKIYLYATASIGYKYLLQASFSY